MSNIKNELRIIMYFLIGYLMLQSIILLIDDYALVSIITFILVGVATLLIVLSVKKHFKNQLEQLFLYLLKNLSIIVGFFVIIYLVEILSFNIISFYNLYEPPIVEDVTMSFFVQILQIITLIVFTPIMEEIVFRKTLIPLLTRKTTIFKSIIIVNSFFALMHVIGLGFPFFFMYLIIGLLLSLAYKVSDDNIFVVIFIHSLLNIASILF
jgi:membrane protease YdiL (CAAX protease family)